KDLSSIKDRFLLLVDCDYFPVTTDRFKFFLWELKFLDSFLSLQSFTFAGECGMLHLTQKMQQIWKTLSDDSPDGFAYWSELHDICPMEEFITFHVPTEIRKTKLENSELNTTLSPKYNGGLFQIARWMIVDDPCSSLFVQGPIKDVIEEVLKELKLLRFFVLFLSKKCIETQIRNNFFVPVLVEASHAAMVSWLYLPSHGKGSQDETDVLVSDILQMKINPIHQGSRKIYVDVLQDLKLTIQPPGWHPNIRNEHASDNYSFVETPSHNLVELPTVSNPSRVVSLNDQVAILSFVLKIWIEGEKEDTALEDVNRALGLDLPSNVQPEFQGCYSLSSVMDQLHIIQKEFESIQPFLKDVGEECHDKHEALQHWATLLIGKAHAVEYVIDACIRKEVPQWCLERWLSDIIEEITLIGGKCRDS
ncbi:hypothetical protein HAX54_011465, partial [Datura stramonium]|nr:hypothetical protein [Datura stramonium]